MDGEKLQVKYFLLSLVLFICKSAHSPARPPIYLLLPGYSDRASETVPAADRVRLPSRASVGLEIDLIRIQIYAFDLTFVRRVHSHDNMLERTE